MSQKRRARFFSTLAPEFKTVEQKISAGRIIALFVDGGESTTMLVYLQRDTNSEKIFPVNSGMGQASYLNSILERFLIKTLVMLSDCN